MVQPLKNIYNLLVIMKETKKQIKAQIINEISTKYSKKIKELEEDRRRAIDSWSRLVEKNSILQAENIRLKDELEKYEDWNRRLQEFMDMTLEEREKIIQDSKLRVATNERLNKIMDMFQYFL